jgi:tetratricopeptide (TPR) repeat protein
MPAFEALAQNQEKTFSQELLESAQNKYYDGEFDETINLAKQCLKQTNLTSEDRFQAYKILAQAYIAKDNLQVARQIITKLVQLDPAYNPTIEHEPPKFVELVTQAKEELNAQEVQHEQVKKGSDMTWIYITTAGVIVLGTAAILLLGKEDKAKPLPQPPGWPEP